MKLTAVDLFAGCGGISLGRMYRSVMLDLSKLGTKGNDIAAIVKVTPQRVSRLLKGHK